MGVYKAKIQYYGSLDELKFRIVVRGYLHNKEVNGDSLSPTVSTRTLSISQQIIPSINKDDTNLISLENLY